MLRKMMLWVKASPGKTLLTDRRFGIEGPVSLRRTFGRTSRRRDGTKGICNRSRVLYAALHCYSGQMATDVRFSDLLPNA